MLRRPPTAINLTTHDLRDYTSRRARRLSEEQASLPTSFASPTHFSPDAKHRTPSQLHSQDGPRKRREIHSPPTYTYDGVRDRRQPRSDIQYRRGVGASEDGDDAGSLGIATEVDEEEFGMEVDLDADVPSPAASPSPLGSDSAMRGVGMDGQLSTQETEVMDSEEEHEVQPGESAQLGEGGEEDTEEIFDDTPIATRNVRRPPVGRTVQRQASQQPPPRPRLAHMQPVAGARQPPPRMGALAQGAAATRTQGAETTQQQTTRARVTRQEMRTPSPSALRVPTMNGVGADEARAAPAPAPRREAAGGTRQGHQRQQSQQQGQQQESQITARQRAETAARERRARVMGAAAEGGQEQVSRRGGAGAGAGAGTGTRRMR